MLRAFLLAGAVNGLLVVVEAFFPQTQTWLPLGGHPLVQSGGIFTAFFSIAVINKCTRERFKKPTPHQDQDVLDENDFVL